MKRNKLIKILSSAALGSILLVGVSACSQNNNSSSESQSTSSKKSHDSSTSHSKSSVKSSVEETHEKQDAVKIKLSQSTAVDKFNKKFPNSKIKSIDLKDESAGYMYEIDGFDNTQEHELTIDAKSGKVIHSSSESLEADDHHQGLDLSNVISRTEAEKIAQKHSSGTPVEWKLEMDEDTNRPEWDITIKNSSTHHTEVKIDATNKKVISSEHDD